MPADTKKILIQNYKNALKEVAKFYSQIDDFITLDNPPINLLESIMSIISTRQLSCLEYFLNHGGLEKCKTKLMDCPYLMNENEKTGNIEEEALAIISIVKIAILNSEGMEKVIKGTKKDSFQDMINIISMLFDSKSVKLKRTVLDILGLICSVNNEGWIIVKKALEKYKLVKNTNGKSPFEHIVISMKKIKEPNYWCSCLFVFSFAFFLAETKIIQIILLFLNKKYRILVNG